MLNSPRILLVEGNPKVNCQRAEAHGTLSTGDRYAKSLRDAFPNVYIDKVFGAEVDSMLPTGSDFSSYDGVVIGGSALHAYSEESPVIRQIDLLREVFNVGLPVLGSCWGLQIAVIAAGGTVAKSANGREVGIARKITLTQEGRGHVFFQGKSSVFDSVCIHMDEIIKIPDGATILAKNKHSRIQALAFKSQNSDFWGVQYHPEFDLFHLSRVITMYDDLMLESGFYNTKEDKTLHEQDLENLSKDPSRTDLAWKLGIDSDVLSDEIRTLEIRNWIEHKVIPRMISSC